MQLNANRAGRFWHKVHAEGMGALAASSDPRMSATSATLQQRQLGGAGKAVDDAAEIGSNNRF
jgi:hypothetical protein